MTRFKDEGRIRFARAQNEMEKAYERSLQDNRDRFQRNPEDVPGILSFVDGATSARNEKIDEIIVKEVSDYFPTSESLEDWRKRWYRHKG